MALLLRSVAAVALLASGCSYSYGRTVNGPAFRGMGWDSGIAYGDARETAQAFGQGGVPASVAANCWPVLGKVVGLGAVGGMMGANADKLSPATVATVGILSLVAAALVPNCFAEIAYDQPPRPDSPRAETPAPAAATVPRDGDPAPTEHPPGWVDPFK